MAGKTFYTGPDGKKRPDHVKAQLSGQAGERNTRPFLLPKGAYNYAQNKGFITTPYSQLVAQMMLNIANLYPQR